MLKICKSFGEQEWGGDGVQVRRVRTGISCKTNLICHPDVGSPSSAR
jgi:hypothetical protein